MKSEELKQLAADAVPIMAVLAFQGGSLFAKTWLDRAKELGIETNVPRISTIDLPDDGA